MYAKYLQEMIGTTIHGGIGPNTLRALANYEEEVGGVAVVIEEYQKRRQSYYELHFQHLIHPEEVGQEE